MSNSSLVGDVECDLDLCPLCQLDLHTVFQFSGVCQEAEMDIKYLLKVCSNRSCYLIPIINCRTEHSTAMVSLISCISLEVEVGKSTTSA